MSTGKALRMRRIIEPKTQSTLMFAFSHGTSSPEVLAGLENPESRSKPLAPGEPTASSSRRG